MRTPRPALGAIGGAARLKDQNSSFANNAAAFNAGMYLRAPRGSPETLPFWLLPIPRRASGGFSIRRNIHLKATDYTRLMNARLAIDGSWERLKLGDAETPLYRSLNSAACYTARGYSVLTSDFQHCAQEGIQRLLIAQRKRDSLVRLSKRYKPRGAS